MRTFRTVSCRVTGYRKKNEGKPCEDATKVLKTGRFTVISAADGHGDRRCVLANIGSQFAVKSACEVLGGYGKQMGKLPPSEYWNFRREEIAGNIVKEYARLCVEDYRKRFTLLSNEEASELFEYINGFDRKEQEALTSEQIREKYAKRKLLNERVEKILYLYGTTLRASVVGDKYVFSIAIGDGDTVMVTDGGVKWLIPKSAAYENTTYSMCDDFSHILSEFVFSYTELSQGEKRGISDNSYNMKMLVLSTDGLRNSFYDDGDFGKKLTEIESLVKEKGTKRLSRPLKRLFCRLTRESVFQDDISAVFGAFFEA